MAWIKNELLKLAPVWFFFFFIIMLLKVTEWAILRELGIKEGVIRNVLILTLIIAKVFILLDNLKFINRFTTKPLIYNILWKTIIYTLMIVLVRLIEKLFSNSIQEVIESIGYPRFWIIQTWTIISVFVFLSTREFIRKIGKENFKKMLFSAP